MKKIFLLLLIFSVLSAIAMEQPTAPSLKELAAKKLAEESIKENKPVDYSKLPDSVAELVFRFINKNTLDLEKLKNYFAVKHELSESFAQYLVRLIQNAVFDVDFNELFKVLSLDAEGKKTSTKEMQYIQAQLRAAFLRLYKKNQTRMLDRLPDIEFTTDDNRSMSLPLDLYLKYEYTPSIDNLLLDDLIVLIFIQKIENEILLHANKEYAVSTDPGSYLNLELIRKFQSC
jgi:hypothetical protein